MRVRASWGRGALLRAVPPQGAYAAPTRLPTRPGQEAWRGRPERLRLERLRPERWRLWAATLGGGGSRGGGPQRRLSQKHAPPAAACARASTHLGERDGDAAAHPLLAPPPGHPLLAPPAGVGLGGEGEVRSARAQQGGREGGDAAVGRRGLECPAAPPWLPPVAPTRREARQRPTAVLGPRGMARQWEGVGRARAGGEGGRGLP